MNIIQSRVRFDGEEHTYTLDGKSLSGITGMIDRRIFGGKYAKIDQDFLRPYAEYGSLVHDELDSYFTVGFEPTNKDAKAFLNWYIAFGNGYTEALSEYTVSDEKRFATNIDIVMRNGDCYDICDFKTTKELDIERIRWQLSICSYLFELQNGFAPTMLLVAHLINGECEVNEVEPIERSKVIELLESEANDLPAISDTESLQRLVDIETALISLQNEAKRLETIKSDVLSKIEKEMERTGMKKIDTDRISITRVLPTTSQSLDTKKLQAEQPELCNGYMRETTKKGFVRITIKKDGTICDSV